MADYAHFVIKKADDEIIIGPVTKMSAIKIVIAESFLLKPVEIDENGMHTEISLIKV